MSQLLLRAGVVCSLGLAAPAVLAGDAATPADKALIDACVIAAAVGQAHACIGRVSDPCMAAPGGQSTAGMNACLSREIAAWDERLNADYAVALTSEAARRATRTAPNGAVRTTTGADLIRATQRAWIAFRDAKCSAAQLPRRAAPAWGRWAAIACFRRRRGRTSGWRRLPGREHPRAGRAHCLPQRHVVASRIGPSQSREHVGRK
ncbi:lysozyme inhibitor LprI family protein [Chelatococcus reniformis]|uniref:Lysozyme inhibitor LprI-like N-terminal domain-containing protein n=1 Tax=Chelatococcus reniformis TaxID=1494448 RepID=A0A916U289_9HYPH|nr:lysozyme inhibitor LprI family protein [Chelatococcus reniformis]GGC57770.1 hypothetical protein GCM10010994_15940 [Chelatococcus reniformis]